MARVRLGLWILACAAVCGCAPKREPVAPRSDSGHPGQGSPVAEAPQEALEVVRDPVPFWKDGQLQGEVDGAKAQEQGYLLLDLGEDWTPYILTERSSPDEEPKPNAYRATYLALARGEFPKDRHGYRAKEDRYLELYGILPTLALLRERFDEMHALQCGKQLDLGPLRSFEGFLAYDPSRRPARRLARYNLLKPEMAGLVERAQVQSLEQLTRDQAADDEQWERVQEYRTLAPEIEVIAAAQARLECEGFFPGRAKYTPGLFDWLTHEALAEFERRHRVYGWGFIGRDTLEVLRMTPEETEQEAVIRALTERAMHAAKVIEDGSTSTLQDGTPRTYETEDGQVRPVPNLEAELREHVIEAFGLQTPESTYAWLQSLGEIPAQKVVALEGLELPPYYGDAMELRVAIDKGDVWYEFPFDEDGKPRPQPVSRRPRITIFVRYNDQSIPLARFGTTIGGWRSEFIDGEVMWKYKDSPVGKRVWSLIAAAPIWVPPESTPPRVMLHQKRDKTFDVDYHTTGPSYASAYGLVAAYHRKFYRSPDGMFQVGGDEGIRTHGSVDYMSIMRRHSHGCHRMHNHLAVRLMSFVLEHRPHKRLGQEPMQYLREFEYEEQLYVMEFDKGGYEFVLDEPLPVEVLPGRIRGQVKQPIEVALPQYDRDAGAYVMPDGQWVSIDRFGTITPRIKPFDFDAPLEAPTQVEELTTTAEAEITPAPPQSSGSMPVAAPAATSVTTAVVPVTPTSASP